MSLIFDSIFSTEVTITTFLLSSASALICGLITAFGASFRSQVSKSFTISLLLLPLIVNTVIIMVNGNVGTGVAVMGAFSLVRFRSVPGKAKDIVSIFLAMTAGLSCATGYVSIALIFTFIATLVMVIAVNLPFKDDRTVDLRITVPESLSFSEALNDILEEYTKNYKLIKVKTTNMGSLYKLLYRAELKDKAKTKDMIDKLRCRNGNLEISVTDRIEGSEEL
ncbi:MAG: DUF4956 domain-containing protein [Clostridia bacterium]|nr:DUF4956 domain-containing protein [Clostridia bacterium]